MKKILFFLFFFSVLPIKAQETTLYETKFENADAEWLWSDVNDEKMYRKIQDGNMEIQHKGQNIFWTLRKGDIADSRTVFETSLTGQEANANSGTGIILKTQDDLYYYFIIYPSEKTYWVGSEQKGTWKTFHGKDENHVAHPAVKGLSEKQDLRVELREDKVAFQINGQEVFSAFRSIRYADLDKIAYYGIVTTATQKIAVSRFAVKELPSLSPKTASAEPLKTAYSTDFNEADATWLWSSVDDANMVRKIENGKMNIIQKGKNYFWSLKKLYTESGDFDMDLVCKVTDTTGGNNAFGMVLLSQDGSQYYFGIKPGNSYYWIAVYEQKKWKTIPNNIAPHTAVKGVGENQELSVRLRGTNLYFYINGQKVYEDLNKIWHRYIAEITSVGIVSTGLLKAEADKFTFRQNQQYSINLAPNTNQPLKRENLGPTVNSQFSDRAQVIAPDGKTIYFVRSDDPKNAGGDDIWFTTLGENGQWLPSQPMSKPLNNESHNCVLSVTPDNNVLLLMHKYNANGSFKEAGFSLSYRNGDTWSMPEDVKMKNYYNLAANNEYTLSPDRKALIMAVQRNDTRGERDLYVSMLGDNHTFSEPVRMGNVINGAKSEISPFMAGDGVTLYFASNSFPGYGDSDIFMTKRLDDTWLNWTKPVNLGPYINSGNWDAYFTLPAQGNYALVCSDKDGSGDIYRIELPQALKPEPVVVVYGNVKNAKNQQPLDAGVEYLDLIKNQQIGIARSNPKDGSYKIILRAGRKYGFLAEKEGFYPISDNLDLSALKEYKEIKRDLLLSPIEKGETIRLNNLFFDFAKANLRPESQTELNRLADFLQKNPDMKIELTGHTDNIGTETDNLMLSDNRIASVKAYLVKKGIAAVRLSTKGFGESKPISANDTEEGRQLNRRVEFKIL